MDGHEREDVVEYRQQFILMIDAYTPRFISFDHDDDLTIIQPTLIDAARRVIFIVHDESIFYSNDAAPMVWVQDDDPDIIRPKSSGRSVMVSGFACSCCGFVNLGTQMSYTTFIPGKSADGWWKCSDLVKQFTEVIPLFQATHPESDLLFLFDNSSNHHAKNPTTPDAYQLNLSDGGKGAPNFRNTVFANENCNMQIGTVQKGVRTILTERHDYQDRSADGHRINLICDYCKIHRSVHRILEKIIAVIKADSVNIQILKINLNGFKRLPQCMMGYK